MQLAPVIGVLVGTTAIAAAQPDSSTLSPTAPSPTIPQTASPPSSPPPAATNRSASVTLSPLHLLPVKIETANGGSLVATVFEAMGEFDLGHRVGVAAILGGGRAKFENAIGDTATLQIFEVGAQGQYYVVGGFDETHSLLGGLEVLYIHVSGEADMGSETALANGLSIGPYVGYKLLTGIGFTFVAQLGVGRQLFKSESSTGMTEEQSDWGPILNLNIGWSF